MESDNETQAPSKMTSALMSLPIAIAIMAAVMVGLNLDVFQDGGFTTLGLSVGILVAGGLVGTAPRLLADDEKATPSLVSLIVGVASIAGGFAICTLLGSPVLGLGFGLMGVLTRFFDAAGRNEEVVIVGGTIAAGILALIPAASTHSFEADGTMANQVYALVDMERAMVAFVFFSHWILGTIIAALTALLVRGRLMDAGSGAWFADLGDMEALKPLLIALGVWGIAHLLSILNTTGVTDPDAFFLSAHLTIFWALGTGAIALFCAFAWVENWRTFGALVAANWLLYTVGNWYDSGLFGIGDIELLTGSMGLLTWAAVFFWANAGIVWAGFNNKISGRNVGAGNGPARAWWSAHGYGVSVALAFVTALVIRTLWNVLPALNGASTAEWDMTGGSDPWYMKRAIDYILAQNSHFLVDMDRSYPVGSINPRPPLFSWSLAMVGQLLAPFVGDIDEAAWWAVAAMPAVYGALTVLPIAAMAKRYGGATAGMVGAWLMALMPGHVSHSTFALADHDAFVILFMSMGFHFWLKAVDAAGVTPLLDSASWDPRHLLRGIGASFSQHGDSMANAMLAGMSFATVALGWKGFVYGLAIIYVAFFVQTALNLLRRRDNMSLSAAALVMMTITFLVPLPFYGNAELGLIWDASGFQPMFYIAAAFILNAWVVTAYRDKPWLMVIVTGVGIAGAGLAILWVLQNVLNWYNGWDILTTGGYYFSKNKIFGTIAEAQAPERGRLFASFGPIVMLFALGGGLISVYRGIRDQDRGRLMLSLWVLIAAYMAWSAGRFVFNATPVMAVMGAISMVALWHKAGSAEFIKNWSRAGVAGSKARFSSLISTSKSNPILPSILMVFILLFSQHAIYGIDAGIPRGEAGEKQVDDTIHGLAPDLMRETLLGFSFLNSDAYTPFGVNVGEGGEANSCRGDCRYMGTFGPGFNSGGWNDAYDWLEAQDSDVTFSERPAFVSWWDYGFQALAQGQHPTVADNFQSGIPAAGNMLLSAGQHDTIALFIATLGEGDMRYEANSDAENADGEAFTRGFTGQIERHMGADVAAEFTAILQLSGEDGKATLIERSHKVIGSADDVALTEGSTMLSDGSMDGIPVYTLYENGEEIGVYSNSDDAKIDFDVNSRVKWGQEGFSDDATHYVIGGYWYTDDIVEDFLDVSTSLHRQNARLALARDLILNTMSLEDVVALYDGITGLEYEVESYESGPGETVTRNHDIRYFAVDNRLYPIAGFQYEESAYHGGNPTGIFYAPTTLAGLDPSMYLQSWYKTQRGDNPEQYMTAAEFEEAYMNDILASQSGAGNDLIELVDIRVDQQPAFFDSMIARTYIGYGGPDLGLQGRLAQPSQHFGGYQGTPGTALQFAPPMPGAMMNHFVIANWFEDGAAEDAFAQTNTRVKVLKYYSGATVEGTVELGDLGIVPNAKILVERDAFSGEATPAEDGSLSDTDDRTFWIPIGTTQADDEGHFSFTAPAGKLRFTAFMGESDLDTARDTLISSGQQGSSWIADILAPTTDGTREVNPVTGILANVSGSTWLGEFTLNVSGEDGHSAGAAVLPITIDVEASGATGTLAWSGEGEFAGEPLADMDVKLTNIWGETEQAPYHLRTGTGVVEGERSFRGTGEVTFTGPGSVISTGVVTVTDFTGTYTRDILHNHSITGDGTFTGRGLLTGDISNGTIADACDNGTVPAGNDTCAVSDGVWLVDGTVIGSGYFTANGTASYAQTLARETLVGAGTFEIDASDDSLDTYGTINGTGTFDGTGTFSGDMVSPGSFHLVDAIPGTYHVEVTLEEGRSVVLPMPLEVGNTHNIEPIALHLPGNLLQGTASSFHGGEAIKGRLVLHQTVQTIDGEPVEVGHEEVEPTGDCAVVVWAPCWIETAEDGTFSHGPILEGEYVLSMDEDDDGFKEYISPPIRVAPGEAQNLTAENVNAIPDMVDITFLLLDAEDQPVDGQNLTFTSPLMPIEVVALGDGEGRYHIELAPGEWIVNSTLDADHLLYEEITLEEEDIDIVLQYTESETVTGRVVYGSDKEDSAPDEAAEGVKGVPVRFQWGAISVMAQTDDDGAWSTQLPVGVGVNATVQTTVSQLLAGEHFTVEVGMDDLELVAEPGHNLAGHLFLYREGNLYDNDFPGFYDQPTMVFAHNEDDSVTWQFPLDQNGRFDMKLLGGNYSITLSDDALNAETLEVEVTEDNASMMMYAYPDMIDVVIQTFLDHSGDGNISNGTAVTTDFSLVAGSGSAATPEDVNITADDDRWDAENGSITLSVEPGVYHVLISAQDAENGSAWDTMIAGGGDGFSLGVHNDTEVREIAFMPRWRTQVDLTNSSHNAPLANFSILFEDVETGHTQTFLTDENGTLLDYIPEGEYIAIVDGFILGASEMEELRVAVSIGADASEDDIISHAWQTAVSAHVNFTVAESHDDAPLGGFTIDAHHETLGDVVLGPSDEDGLIEARMFPGEWTFSLNRTDGSINWQVNQTNDLASGWGDNITLDATRTVKLAGNLFWDLNNDGVWNLNEGIEGANVTISADGAEDVELVSSETGTWMAFVDINTNYTVTAAKEGFSPESVEIELGVAPNSTDIELLAGSVDVAGNVDHIISGEWANVADDVEIRLMPYTGLSRDAVTPTLVMEDDAWTGDWSASIEPGKWVVHAWSDANGIAAIGLLDATIANGGELNLTLSDAGVVHLATSWTDFHEQSHTLADTNVDQAPMQSEPAVIVDGGIDLRWNLSVDADGGIDLLLPSGAYTFDSQFTTTERGLDMRYSAGKSVEVAGGQESPEIDLTFRRHFEHSVDFSIVNSTGGESGEDADVINLVKNEEGYDEIIVDLEMTYLGNMALDAYEIDFTINGGDAAAWMISVENETGEWAEEANFTLGLDSDLSTIAKIKIEAPTQDLAIAYEGGHSVIVTLSHAEGTTSSHEFAVVVPQDFGFELSTDNTDNVLDTLGISPGSSETIPLMFENTGNGDDTYEVSIDDSEAPEGWSFNGPSSLPTSPRNVQSWSLNAVSPSNASGSFSIFIDVTSEDNTSYDRIEVPFEVAKPVLAIKDVGTHAEGGTKFGSANEQNVFWAIVENTGIVSAGTVAVELWDEDGNVVATEYGIIDKESERSFEFSVLLDVEGGTYNIGEHVFEVHINTTGMQVDEDPENEKLVVNIQRDAGEEANVWIGIIVGVVFILGGYGLWKMTKSTGRGRQPF